MAFAEDLHVSLHQISGTWARSFLTFSGWLVGTYLVTMLAWVAGPAVVLGWDPAVVVSGSMQPNIKAGDVVLTEEVGDQVEPGTVIAFDSGQGTVLHRVTAVGADGAHTTKGDANPGSDSSPISHDQIIGQGRLVVPYLGLVRIVSWGWWLALGVLATVSLPLWRWGAGLSVAVVVTMLALAGLASALAMFSDTAANPSSSIGAVEVQSPTELTAACGTIGSGVIPVDLNWTASPTTSLTGYRILHQGPEDANLTELGAVGPAVTSFTHDISESLVNVGEHTYAVQGEVTPWLSAMSGTDAVSVTQIGGLYTCTEL